MLNRFSVTVLFSAATVMAALPSCSPREGDNPGGSGALAQRPVGCPGCVVLTGGIVFDGTRADKGTVVLKDDKIIDVRFGDVSLGEGEKVDVSNKTVLSGLVDMHVHVGSPPSVFAHYKAMLRSGVTSAVDLGAPQNYIGAQRADLAAGRMPGPNLFVTGAMVTHTFGHACLSDNPHVAFGAPFPPELGHFCEFVDTPDKANGAVAAIAQGRPDLLKIIVEGGTPGGPIQSMRADAIAAVVGAAGKAGIRPIAHVGKAADVAIALDAGVRFFAHVPYEDRVTKDLADRAAKAGAVMVPTLVLTDAWARLKEGTFTELADPALAEDVTADKIAKLKDPAFLAKLGAPGWPFELAGPASRENAIANFRILREAGVKVVAGTDAGNDGVFHGLALRRELELYVQNGMTPQEAIVAATMHAADALSQPTRGRLSPGAVADVLVVEGRPLENIRDLGKVHLVYKGGKLVDRAALALPRN